MSTKILSIEDSEFERESITNLLAENGYNNIAEAATAEEGLEKYDEDTDLVLLDLRLPDMDGIDVLKELEEKNADVIIVSVVREEKTKNETKDIGAEAYVEKPITEDKLIPPIEEVLE
ncbi:MAG: response regulator [Candidatus Nanohalobium sp.]